MQTVEVWYTDGEYGKYEHCSMVKYDHNGRTVLLQCEKLYIISLENVFTIAIQQENEGTNG